MIPSASQCGKAAKLNFKTQNKREMKDQAAALVGKNGMEELTKPF